MYVTKPMEYKKLAKLLSDAGFEMQRQRGSHQVWRCGSVVVTITKKNPVSAAVVRDAEKAIKRSEEA